MAIDPTFLLGWEISCMARVAVPKSLWIKLRIKSDQFYPFFDSIFKLCCESVLQYRIDSNKKYPETKSI